MGGLTARSWYVLLSINPETQRQLSLQKFSWLRVEVLESVCLSSQSSSTTLCPWASHLNSLHLVFSICTIFRVGKKLYIEGNESTIWTLKTNHSHLSLSLTSVPQITSFPYWKICWDRCLLPQQVPLCHGVLLGSVANNPYPCYPFHGLTLVKYRGGTWTYEILYSSWQSVIRALLSPVGSKTDSRHATEISIRILGIS